MNYLKLNFRFFSVIIMMIFCKESGAQMFWNQTCQFAGSNTSYISVPSTAGTNLTGSFSAEAWVNCSNVSGSERGDHIQRFGVRRINEICSKDQQCK